MNKHSRGRPEAKRGAPPSGKRTPEVRGGRDAARGDPRGPSPTRTPGGGRPAHGARSGRHESPSTAPRAPHGERSSAHSGPPKGPPRSSGKAPQKVASERLVYGTHAIVALIENQPKLVEKLYVRAPAGSIADRARLAGIAVEVVEGEVLDSIVGPIDGGGPQGLVARIHPFPTIAVEDLLQESPQPRCILALDGVTDPRNLGAAVRAAHALGATHVLVPGDRAAGINAAAHKAAAGATFRVQIVEVINFRRALDQLKAAGYWTVGAEADAKVAPWQVDLTDRVVLIIGGEDTGLRRLTREACDHVVAIPMAAKDVSLNAADAATVLLYEALKQRRMAPR